MDDRGYLLPDLPTNLGRPFTDSSHIMTSKVMEHLLTKESAESAFSRHALFCSPNTSPFFFLTGNVSSHVTPSWQDPRYSPLIGQLIDFE